MNIEIYADNMSIKYRNIEYYDDFRTDLGDAFINSEKVQKKKAFSPSVKTRLRRIGPGILLYDHDPRRARIALHSDIV